MMSLFVFSVCYVVQDGAFLVRDSSKGSYVQPYTLMVLYQDKVYNIQIRRDHNAFLLGTGLKATEVEMNALSHCSSLSQYFSKGPEFFVTL